jgi:YVTN family beta-propeller protein
VSAIDLASGHLIGTARTGKETEAIDLSPDGRELWVGNGGEDTLTVLDAEHLTILASIPCGRVPTRLGFTPDGERVLVTCAGSGEVAVINAKERQEILRIAMPGPDLDSDAPKPDPATLQPIGLLIDPRGKFAFAACTAIRKLAVIDLRSWKISGEISTGNGPDGMAWTRKIQPFQFFDDPLEARGSL